jgi:hypothetical protein
MAVIEPKISTDQPTPTNDRYASSTDALMAPTSRASATISAPLLCCCSLLLGGAALPAVADLAGALEEAASVDVMSGSIVIELNAAVGAAEAWVTADFSYNSDRY